MSISGPSQEMSCGTCVRIQPCHTPHGDIKRRRQRTKQVQQTKRTPYRRRQLGGCGQSRQDLNGVAPEPPPQVPGNPPLPNHSVFFSIVCLLASFPKTAKYCRWLWSFSSRKRWFSDLSSATLVGLFNFILQTAAAATERTEVPPTVRRCNRLDVRNRGKEREIQQECVNNERA